MPATFRFPNERTQIWLPLVLDPAHAQAAGFNYNAILNNFGVTFELLPNVVAVNHHPGAGTFGTGGFH